MTTQPLEAALLHLEEAFWKGDAEFYRRNLTTNALMVFAEPVGLMSRDVAIAAITAGPRWASVAFEDTHIVPLTADSVLVTYRATAQRSGERAPYAALVSSIYVSTNGSWKLAFHQQTPATT